MGEESYLLFITLKKQKRVLVLNKKKNSQGKDTLGEEKKIPPNTFSLIEDPISLSSEEEMDCRRKGTNEPDTLWSRIMGLQSSLQCVMSSD